MHSETPFGGAEQAVEPVIDSFRKRGRSRAFLWGTGVGAALVLYWGWRLMRPGNGERDVVPLDPETVRTIAAGALLADPGLRRFNLQVRSIAPGILDLSGVIDSVERAEHALMLVRRGPGVRTVLNRMDIAEPARTDEVRPTSG